MGRFHRLTACAVMAVAAACATQGLAATDAVETLTRRQFILTAHQKCQLLNPAEVTALNAGLVQSRNQLVRAGISRQHLKKIVDQAKRAAQNVDCTSPSLLSETETVRGAYRKFVAQTRLDLPSGRASWRAERSHGDDIVWRLAQYQDTDAGNLAFGLYGTLTRFNLTVMAQFKDAKAPYAARLLMRDPRLNTVGVITPDAYELSDALPFGFSERYSQSFVASNRRDTLIALGPSKKVNFAGFDLSGKRAGKPKSEPAVRFDFPSSAMIAMAGLDPREDIVVAFDFADKTRYARFEIGDFITGAGFIALPSPYTANQVNSAR